MALSQFVTTNVGDVPQPYKGVIVFHPDSPWPPLPGERRGAPTTSTSNEEAYDQADLHFKMQYRLEGYGYRDRLVPGGYVNNHPDIYAFLPHLRALRDTAPPLYDVHGRFGLSFEVRRRALEILRASSAFQFMGGQTKVRYGSFLREVARSRICIDLPSYSPITFRLIDYLAIGCCVIGPSAPVAAPRAARGPRPLVYCKPDYSDLEELCVHYLRNDSDRRALVANSRGFFDAFLHGRQLAAYYLSHCVRLLA